MIDTQRGHMPSEGFTSVTAPRDAWQWLGACIVKLTTETRSLLASLMTAVIGIQI